MAVAVVAAGVQVLLTHDDLRNRRRYLNARATLNGLLTLDVLPVVNENDTVAVDELKLGDNDNLPAIVAALFDADLLLIAYDVAALYAANPRRDPAAARIARVEAISPAVTAMAGGSNSTVGTGGMRTKLEAGIPTALSDGRDAATVQALAQGWLHGTLVCAPAPACRHANTGCATPRPAGQRSGRIRIDQGAARALEGGRASKLNAPLLPGDILGADGEFQRGDLVEVVDEADLAVARGLSQYAVAEVRRQVGRQSREIETVLGCGHGAEVVHHDDLASVPGQSASGCTGYGLNPLPMARAFSSDWVVA